jgi:hypothetical protein
MPKSYTLKTIQLTITLGKGNFSQGGNTKTIEGLACDATIQKPGLPEKNSAAIKVWGLSYEDMAQLTMLAFRPLESHHNLISIKAGEKGGALPLVFAGEIVSASADFNAAPDVCMDFEADTGSYPQQISAPVATVKGEAQADQLFSQFADTAGYTFKNEGVTASVQNAWFPGSPIDKMTKLARDIGCELLIDDGQIVILPAGQARAGNAVLLSRDTGLIGYPTFNQDGISCRCIFNPNLAYGGLIKVEKSIVPKANGAWRITKLTHHITAYVPGGGNWESQIEAAPYE